MRFSVPHPIPYQGSKRRLAAAILSHVPANRYTRLVEPFAGSAAVTLAAAHRNLFPSYVIGDALEPLIELWKMVINHPTEVADMYEMLWHRERERPIDAYYEIRSEFNADRSPLNCFTCWRGVLRTLFDSIPPGISINRPINAGRVPSPC